MLQMIVSTHPKLPSRIVLQILQIISKLLKIKVISLKNTYEISQFLENYKLLPLVKLQAYT